MNLLLALLMLTVPPEKPHIYFYNSHRLVPLRTIELPSARRAGLRFFIRSPYELLDARVDSSDAGLCLPDISLRRKMGLEGRWYIVTWNAQLSAGSSAHRIFLYSWRHRKYEKTFRINVEGSKRIEKPQGVN